MTTASIPMHVKAYRVAAHDSPIAMPRSNRTDDGVHEAVVAYESPELASLCTFETLAHESALLRETLLLPGDPHLHRHLTVEGTGTWSDTPQARREFFRYLKRNSLLCAWVPSEFAENQHILLLDPEHPAYGSIPVEFRYLTQRAHDQHDARAPVSGLLLPDGMRPVHRGSHRAAGRHLHAWNAQSDKRGPPCLPAPSTSIRPPACAPCWMTPAGPSGSFSAAATPATRALPRCAWPGPPCACTRAATRCRPGLPACSWTPASAARAACGA